MRFGSHSNTFVVFALVYLTERTVQHFPCNTSCPSPGVSVRRMWMMSSVRSMQGIPSTVTTSDAKYLSQ